MYWKIIKRFKNYEISSTGKVKHWPSGKYIKPICSEKGKMHVYIHGHKLSIYRLIAKAFIGNQYKCKANSIEGARNYLAVSDGRIFDLLNDRFVWFSDRIDRLTGYLSVILTFDNGDIKSSPIHRLIATTLIPNSEDLPVVNHIDHNKFNNCGQNLEWVTYSGNRRAYCKFVLHNGKPLPSFLPLESTIILKKKHISCKPDLRSFTFTKCTKIYRKSIIINTEPLY